MGSGHFYTNGCRTPIKKISIDENFKSVYNEWKKDKVTAVKTIGLVFMKKYFL